MWTATSGHERTADHWPFGGGDCVVALAVLEYGESPELFVARTR